MKRVRYLGIFLIVVGSGLIARNASEYYQTNESHMGLIFGILILLIGIIINIKSNKKEN
jgi:uncharacterized membrane protein HdeD (DUF308 family)